MRTNSMFQTIVRYLLIPYDFIVKSLYRKIWFCFFITITITVTALGFDYYINTSSDIKQRAIGNMEQLSNQSASTLESYMSNIKNFAWEYFSDVDFQGFARSLGSDPETYSMYSSKFSQFILDNPAADFIMISQLDGNSLSKGNLTRIDDLDFNRLTAIATANDGKGEWVPVQTYDSKLKQYVNTLVFTQAIKLISLNSNFPIVGILCIELSPNYLKQWLGDIGSEEQGQYALVDSADGKIMLSSDAQRIGSQLGGMTDLYKLGYGVSSRYRFGDDQGVQTLFVSHKLDKTSWVLVGKVPLHTLLRQANVLAKRTILIGAVCLLGAMLIASLLASKIITPLKLLKKGIISIEKGDYRIAVPVRSKDEIGFFIRRFNQMANEINMLIVKVYEADLVKKDAEIKSLQSQINPHFLYNALGMIDSLAALHEDDRISLISSSLAKMFRYNISAGHMSTLQAEIRQLEIYLSIQQIRFTDRLQHSIVVEEGLHAILIPKLLLQPMVENSFVHAIDHMTSGGEIRIRASSVSDTDAVITVWNNGPVIEPRRLKKLQEMLEQCHQQNYVNNTASSIGLFNVQYRIKLVFGSEYGLTIQSDEDLGTLIRIRVKKMRVEESPHEADDRG